MARVEWALLCDLAYFDAYKNLCVIGAQTQTPVATFSAGTHRLTIAARLAGLQPRPDVVVSMLVPDGGPCDSTWERMDIESVGDYPLVRLAGVPMTEEGIYRFEVSLYERELTSIDIPVQVIAHRSDHAGLV